MPHAELNKCRIHYALEGPADAPVLVLSNSLGTDLHMWDTVVNGFTDRYRVLRYDTRGHGQSGMPEGAYTLSMLGMDVLALLESLKMESAMFCGISIGGMTGIWLGLHAGNLISKVILANTAARIGTADSWNDRIHTVEQWGLAPIAEAALERWFTPAFRARESGQMATILTAFQETRPQGYCSCCAAIRDADFYPSLGEIRKPSLVFSGAGDPVTPPLDGRRLAEEIAGADYCELSGRHLAPLEDVEVFTRTALNFLGQKASNG
jgi:3-oxoadipate enol-lactonase